VGYYNRFDVFQLNVNRRLLNPAEFNDAGGAAADADALYGPYVPPNESM
jgi:nitrilase